MEEIAESPPIPAKLWFPFCILWCIIRDNIHSGGLSALASHAPVSYTHLIDMAVQAGAIRETVEIIEVEDVPLAYYPGNTNRVKIKAAGDLRG